MNSPCAQPCRNPSGGRQPHRRAAGEGGARISKLVNNLHTVLGRRRAIAFLRREGRYKDAPRPGLILLDLNLPKKDGREVLAEIKNDEALKRIPVVVLTTSQERGRHPESLRPARQLLYRETRGLREVRRRRAQHREFLVRRGDASDRRVR